MTPTSVKAKITLNFPVYTCDFDPLDPSTLIVGGGGGASKTGIGNKIVVLNTSNAEELVIAAEIELSRDEDNPTSLAVGQNHLVYAGVNSSPKEIEEGRNLHFRVYEIKNTAGHEIKTKTNKQSTQLKIEERLRCSLFKEIEKNSYQRITRLARAYPGDECQLGVVATGLAQIHEIVLFETAGYYPPSVRETIEIDKEAVDVDLFQTNDRVFQIAYCNEYAIYLKKITFEKEDETSRCIYLVPTARSNQKLKFPSLRAIRWITKDHIIILTNLHGNSGVTLQLITVPSMGEDQSRVIQSIQLPRRLTKATGLCVVDLTPREKLLDEQNSTQFVIAVAGHDRSLFLFTIDMKLKAGIPNLSKINTFCTFKNVHPLQITNLAFSRSLPTKNPTKSRTEPPLLRLASVGISNTVVVHTLPLFPIDLSTKYNQGKDRRYVVALPSRIKNKGVFMSIGILVILLIAVYIQAILEIKGSVTKYLGARERVPTRWQEALGLKAVRLYDPNVN